MDLLLLKFCVDHQDVFKFIYSEPVLSIFNSNSMCMALSLKVLISSRVTGSAGSLEVGSCISIPWINYCYNNVSNEYVKTSATETAAACLFYIW